MLYSFLFILGSIIILGILITRLIITRSRRDKSFAFFHLYCSSGGGGERVLWHAIEALLRKYPEYKIYIYTHHEIKPSDKGRVLSKVEHLFKIDLNTDSDFSNRLEFVPLKGSPLIESRRYPILTLLGQNLGSILLAFEAAYRLIPEVYVETIGFTFTLPLFKLLGCTVITYVHYPTISSDMIQNVKTSTHASFNNREIFVKYPSIRKLKLIYYKTLVLFYGFAGRRADLVLVNSSWTQAHINSLWSTNTHVLFPPCDVDNFKSISRPKLGSQQHSNALNIISVAQFRPEKNHQLQIEAFDSFLKETAAFDSKLILYGGCRDEEDKRRVAYLRDFIHTLELGSNVEIIVGASFERLLEGMMQAQVAIHTMEDEHFGIVLVECMAAGLITIAHNSGGPKTDIIDDNKNGFLACEVQDFAEKLILISQMSSDDRLKLSSNAIEKSEKFNSKTFEKNFIKLVDKIILAKR